MASLLYVPAGGRKYGYTWDILKIYLGYAWDMTVRMIYSESKTPDIGNTDIKISDIRFLSIKALGIRALGIRALGIKSLVSGTWYQEPGIKSLNVIA